MENKKTFGGSSRRYVSPENLRKLQIYYSKIKYIDLKRQSFQNSNNTEGL